jgi:hypothetical protein
VVDMPANVAALIAEYARPPPRSVWLVQVATDGYDNDVLYVFATKDDADEFVEVYEGLENNAVEGGTNPNDPNDPNNPNDPNDPNNPNNRYYRLRGGSEYQPPSNCRGRCRLRVAPLIVGV